MIKFNQMGPDRNCRLCIARIDQNSPKNNFLLFYGIYKNTIQHTLVQKHHSQLIKSSCFTKINTLNQYFSSNIFCGSHILFLSLHEGEMTSYQQEQEHTSSKLSRVYDVFMTCELHGNEKLCAKNIFPALLKNIIKTNLTIAKK